MSSLTSMVEISDNYFRDPHGILLDTLGTLNVLNESFFNRVDD